MIPKLGMCGTAFFAQQGRFADLSNRFRPGNSQMDTGDMVVLVLILAVLIAAVCLLAQYLNLKERSGFKNPRAMFRQLSRAHQLDWKTRSLLRQLARAHKLSQPAELFLQPQLFESSHLVQSLQTRRQELTELRRKLFAGLADDISVTPSLEHPA